MLRCRLCDVEREAVEGENDKGGGQGNDENGAGEDGEGYPNWVRTSPLPRVPRVSPFLRRRISSRFLTGLDGQTEKGREGETDDNLGVEPEESGRYIKGTFEKIG